MQMEYRVRRTSNTCPSLQVTYPVPGARCHSRDPQTIHALRGAILSACSKLSRAWSRVVPRFRSSNPDPSITARTRGRRDGGATLISRQGDHRNTGRYHVGRRATNRILHPIPAISAQEPQAVYKMIWQATGAHDGARAGGAVSNRRFVECPQTNAKNGVLTTSNKALCVLPSCESCVAFRRSPTPNRYFAQC